MLMPSKTKYRKRMKGRLKGSATQGERIVFGTLAIQATGRGFVNSREIEAARRAITRRIRRTGKLWIRVFPDKPLTKRPAETRMGKGKGSLDKWVCPVKPGRILFEIDGVEDSLSKSAFNIAQSKLSVSTQIVERLP